MFYDDRPVATVSMLADAYGYSPVVMRTLLCRLRAQPATYLDTRTPLYDRVEVDHLVSTMPGRGNRRVTQSV
jgi:hypothetical protein